MSEAEVRHQASDLMAQVVMGHLKTEQDLTAQVNKLTANNMKLRSIIVQIERVMDGMDAATTDPEIIRAQLAELKETLGGLVHDYADANS